MTSQLTIGLALDLARMPMLARASAAPQPIPQNIVDLMQIAAASPKACKDAAASTGEPEDVLIEAARFYLQQLLFRPDADCYRILGIQKDTSRAVARDHMRWLLKWLHPDRNGDLDAVYAERVVKAWREVSVSTDTTGVAERPRADSKNLKMKNGAPSSFRMPWIKSPVKRPHSENIAMRWVVSSGLLLVILAIWLATAGYFNVDQIATIIRVP